MRALLGGVVLFQSFAFHFLEYFLTFSMTCSVSVEKSIASLIGAPLYDTSSLSLAAFKILCIWILPLSLWCVLKWASWGSSWLGFSVLPRPVWLFLSSNQRIFPSLLFQTGFLSLALCTLLLGSLLYQYYYVPCYPAVSLTLFILFEFFPLFPLSGSFFQHCHPSCWFNPLIHLACSWFLLLYSSI